MEQANSGAVLVVTPFEEDHAALRRIFDRSDWELYEAHSISEAMRLLARRTIPVVICERDLPVGDWRALLGALQFLPHPPHLIVSSRLADNGLWAEVLNLGGYDVQPIPFDAAEILHKTQLARLNWGNASVAVQVA